MSSQVNAWAGDFGDAYTERNVATEEAVATRHKMWQEVMSHVERPSAMLEVGCNVGINLHALRRLFPLQRKRFWHRKQTIDKGAVILAGIDPNLEAIKSVDTGLIGGVSVGRGSVSDLGFWLRESVPEANFDFVFTTGVLIHIPPSELLAACTNIYNASSKYILCTEYFSQQPREQRYRGRDGMMWLRDFGGFYLDNFPGLRVVANGFWWKRTTGLDDVTWTLMEKI